MVMELSAAALTVSDAGELVMAPTAAVIYAVPALTPVLSPRVPLAFETVAMASLLLVQVASSLTSWIELSP